MKCALITGITGQDSLYLVELLTAKGYEVFGMVRGFNNPRRDVVSALLPGAAPSSSLVRSAEWPP